MAETQISDLDPAKSTNPQAPLLPILLLPDSLVTFSNFLASSTPKRFRLKASANAGCCVRLCTEHLKISTGSPRGGRYIHAYKSMNVELVGRHKFKDTEFAGVKCGQTALCRTEWNTLLPSFLFSMVPYDSQEDPQACFRPTLETILNLQNLLLGVLPSLQMKVLSLTLPPP